ncbi:MAG: ATP-dependent helicase [Phycisphaerales bacterium JB043]
MSDTRTLLEGLTDAQAQAVQHTDGPLLVLAAAGSGKTRVITRRIAYLLAQGVPPWRIIALTFTNKAAGEMRARVEHILDANPMRMRGLTITTFHSLCARLLRKYAERASIPGLSPDYVIYDSADQSSLMKRVVKNLHMNTSNWPPRKVLAQISNAKNDLMTAHDYESVATDYYTNQVARLYNAYERALRDANALDFDDLLLHVAHTLREHDEIREEIQDRWKYLLIDEYQDTNSAQFAIASRLVGKNPEGDTNICVVGDPDQSIYAWRGADIRNILDFETHYPGARTIALGENFRSCAPILHVADTLIKNNVKRKDKPLFTTSEGGAPPQAITCADERAEATHVVRWLQMFHVEHSGSDDPVAWKDMAIMYRTNALSRVLEDACRQLSVPYVIARGTAFFEREEVKDVLAYLRIVVNLSDEVSLRRVINKPARGIGKATIDTIEQHAFSEGVPMEEAIRFCAQNAQDVGLTTRSATGVNKFLMMIDEWRESTEFMGEETTGQLAALVERVVRDSGLEAHYAKKIQRDASLGEDKLENLDELISSARQFEEDYQPGSDPSEDVPNLDDEDWVPDFAGDIASDIEGDQFADLPPTMAMLRAYLEQVALVSDADSVDPTQGALTLMTLHASKGLEFDAVAIVGLEEGLLPHSRALDDPDAMEEERRLLFVGVTRARKHLMLSGARYRTHRGMHERTIASRFLSELPEDGIEAHNLTDETTEASSWDEPSAGIDDLGYEPVADDSDAMGGLREGLKVRHPRFGIGRVEAILSTGRTPRVRIAFRDVGVKTIVLGYAPLEPME